MEMDEVYFATIPNRLLVLLPIIDTHVSTAMTVESYQLNILSEDREPITEG